MFSSPYTKHAVAAITNLSLFTRSFINYVLLAISSYPSTRLRFRFGFGFTSATLPEREDVVGFLLDFHSVFGRALLSSVEFCPSRGVDARPAFVDTSITRSVFGVLWCLGIVFANLLAGCTGRAQWWCLAQGECDTTRVILAGFRLFVAAFDNDSWNEF